MVILFMYIKIFDHDEIRTRTCTDDVISNGDETFRV